MIVVCVNVKLASSSSYFIEIYGFSVVRRLESRAANRSDDAYRGPGENGPNQLRHAQGTTR